MRTWFLSKVTYSKETDQGLLKKINEEYLFDGVSFTEVEASIYTKLGEMIRGDFSVKSISRTNIVDVFYYEDSDIWHKCKIVYHVADADTGKEKKVTQYMILTADNVDQAYDRINESLSNMLVSFSVPKIEETNIVEVFPFEREDDVNEPIPSNFRKIEVEEEEEV